MKGLPGRQERKSVWQFCSEAVRQIRRTVGQRTCLSSFCSKRALGGLRRQSSRKIFLSGVRGLSRLAARSRRNYASTWLEDARRTSAYVLATTRSGLRRCLLDGGVKDETHVVLEHNLAHVVELVNEEYL